MSDTAQDAFWEDYKDWCNKNSLQATYDGFGVWLSDGDLAVDWDE